MLINFLKKLLFDNSCSLCGKTLENEDYLCKKCSLRLKEMSFLKKRENLYFIYFYTDVKKLIIDFKFKNRKNISLTLKKYVKDILKELIISEQIDIVIPVPASTKRITERGFNQVEELLKSCDIPFENIKRIKNTKYMYTLNNKEKREENIKNAFKIENSYFKKNILIVDDIVTTGSTLSELKQEIEITQNTNKVILFSLSVVRSYFKK